MNSNSPFSFAYLHGYLKRHKILLLLISLLTMLLILPFIDQRFELYTIFLELSITAILLAGIYVVSRNKRLLSIAILLGILILTIIWFNLVIQSKSLVILSLILELIFFGLTTITILAFVMQFEKVTVDKIHGAVCAYLLIGICWAVIYTLLETILPGSFSLDSQHIRNYPSNFIVPANFIDFVYYSFITMTTLGYGDILPLTNPARALASIEAINGQMFIAVLISRLVALHIIHSGGNIDK